MHWYVLFTHMFCSLFLWIVSITRNVELFCGGKSMGKLFCALQKLYVALTLKLYYFSNVQPVKFLKKTSSFANVSQNIRKMFYLYFLMH